MTLASTSRAQLALVKETAFGTTPGSGSSKYIRMTGESLDFTLKKEASKEIRSDRMLSSVVPVGAQAQGGINFEMSYNEYDDLIESLLQDTWTVFGVAGVGATFTADFTATTITASVATSGASIFTDLKPGQWFRLLAPTHANNGHLFRVSTTVAPTTTVLTVDASTVLATGTGVTSCAVQTSRLTNGTTQTSFTLEKSFTDVTQLFAFKGMTPSKLSLKFASGSLTEGSIDFLGTRSVRGVVTVLPGTIAASHTYDIHNAATGVGQVWEGTTPLTSTFIKSLSFDYDNALRGQEAIGTLGLVGIGNGTIAIKGTAEIYFADGTLYDKFLANTYTAFTVSTQDADGNGYVITFPKVNLDTAKIVAGSKDQDLMASFTFQAVEDAANATAALRKEIFIDRVGVAIT